MAELLGAASGALGVAEVGFSLASTLYKYASSVKSAEKELKAIAKDIELTSKVLKQTHEQIQKDQDAKLCTNEAIDLTRDVLQGCRDAFQEVDDELNRSIKVDAGGQPIVSMTSRFKFPLKSNKMELLRANLDKLKTTLLLMLSVLAYGRKISLTQSATVEVKADISLERLQIQNLVLARDEATQRYEELGASFARLESRLATDTYQQIPPPPAPPAYSNFSFMARVPPPPAPPMSYKSSLPPPPPPRFDVNNPFVRVPSLGSKERQIGNRGLSSSRSTDSSDAETSKIPKRPVGDHLGLCASAVRRLAATIDHATQRWQLLQVLEHNSIAESLHATTEAIAFLNRSSRLSYNQPGAEDEVEASLSGLYSQHEERESFRAMRPNFEFDPSLSAEGLRLPSTRTVEIYGDGFERQRAARTAPLPPPGTGTITKANELGRMKSQIMNTSAGRGEAYDHENDVQDDAETSAGRFPIRPAAQKNLAERAKYQFEADSEDDEMENKIEDDLDAIHRSAKTLNQLGRAMGQESDSQNRHIESVIKKTDKVDDSIAVNRQRLDRIDGSFPRKRTEAEPAKPKVQTTNNQNDFGQSHLSEHLEKYGPDDKTGRSTVVGVERLDDFFPKQDLNAPHESASDSDSDSDSGLFAIPISKSRPTPSADRPKLSVLSSSPPEPDSVSGETLIAKIYREHAERQFQKHSNIDFKDGHSPDTAIEDDHGVVDDLLRKWTTIAI